MFSKKLWPSDLDLYSSLIGSNAQLTQGPGGNTSWKDSDHLWIKASGFHLEDAQEKSIFVPVSLNKPTKGISSGGLRPSIESWMHASIPEPVVYHVHSIGSVALSIVKLLTKEHRNLLKFYNLGAIDYVSPGKELATHILRERENNPDIEGILLGNHGLVVWGQEFEGLYSQLLEIENDMCNLLKIDPARKNLPPEMAIRLEKVGFITPDHVVFAELIREKHKKKESLWTEKLLWALSLSLSAIPESDTPKTLSAFEIELLLSWSEEKYRQKVQS